MNSIKGQPIPKFSSFEKMFQFKQVDGDVHSVSFGAAADDWSSKMVEIFFFKTTQHLNAKHLFDFLKLQTYDRWLNSEKGTKFEGYFLATDNNPLDMNSKLEVKIAAVGDETSGAYIHPVAVPHAVYWAAPQHCLAIHKMQRAIEEYCARHPSADDARKAKQHDKHVFCILKLNAVSYWQYFIIECKAHKFHKKFQHARKMHSKATIAYKQDLVPNVIKVADELKSDKRIMMHENYCSITQYLPENKFFAIVTDICQCDDPIIDNIV